MNKKNKYDFIVSLGRDCSCSMYLREHNLQEKSYPFDWLTHDAKLEGCLDIRFELILNDFKNFMNLEDLKYLPKDPNVLNDNKNDYYENTRNGLYYYHDFPKGSKLKDSIEKVKDKYNRRIERFYNSLKKHDEILMVWFAHQPNISDSKIIEYSERLNNKFNKTIDIVIFENNKNHPVEDFFDKMDLSDCVVKYVLNTYPSDVDDKTKGNVKLCDEVFRLYDLKRSPDFFFVKRLWPVIKKRNAKFVRSIKKRIFKKV